MKTLTKLLYIEVDEEVTDLVDRLRSLQDEDAVTFVVPDRARSLQSPMSFRLLKRYADAYGKHVNVISPDARLQALALESGFTTYPTLSAYDAGSEVHRPTDGQAEANAPAAAAAPVSVASPARAMTPAPAGAPIPAVAPAAPAAPAAPVVAPVPRTRTAEVVSPLPKARPAKPAKVDGGPKLPRDRRLFYIGGGALAALIAIVAILLVPTADVAITVTGTPLKVDMQLLGVQNPVAGTIDHFPTQVITSSASLTAQGTATGQKQIPAIAATGDVVFTSTCNVFCTNWQIRKGAVVKSNDGKQYSTTAAASLPSNSSVTVPVQSLDAGAGGNTGAGTVRTIENNPDPTQLSVNNPNAIGGGADQRVATVIQQSDIDAVTQALTSQLNPKVQDDLNNQAKGKHLVSADQPKIDTSSDHNLGDETPNFNTTMTITATGVVFDNATVINLLRNALQRKVPYGSALTADQPKISYDVAQATSDGNVTLNGHASGFTFIVFSQPAIRAHIKGHSPSSARAFLQSLPNVVDVTLRQSPIPLPWLPFFSSRINVQIQEVSGTSTP